MSYILPIRSKIAVSAEFSEYVNWLSNHTEVLIVDGSADGSYRSLAERLAGSSAHTTGRRFVGVEERQSSRRHIRIAASDARYIIIADDDVRYTAAGIRHLASALTRADVVRPRITFGRPHGMLVVDTARTLINRASGGDWPGTIAVRRSMVAIAGRLRR